MASRPSPAYEIDRRGWGHFQTLVAALLASCGSLFACGAMLPIFITPFTIYDAQSKTDRALGEGVACGPSGSLVHGSLIRVEEALRSFSGEFGLVCARAWLAPLSGSAFFMGTLLGAAALAPLADTHGRLRVHKAAVALVVLGFAVTALAPWVPVFIAGRLLTGIGLGCETPVRFLLAGESVPSSSKALLNFCLNCGSTMGTVILCGLAALVPGNWRVLTLLSGLPLGVAILVSEHFILVETPAFLAANNPELVPEALKRMAAWGGAGHAKRLEDQAEVAAGSGAGGVAWLPSGPGTPRKGPCPPPPAGPRPPQPGALVLVREPRLRGRFLCLLVAWAASSHVFYGVSLGAGVLGGGGGSRGSIVAATLSSALAEVPSYVLCASLAQAPLLGRRGSLVLMLLCTCLSCLLLPWLPAVGLPVAKFFATAGFGLVYIYSPELFPASVRGSALGALSAAARAATVLVPTMLAQPPRLCLAAFASLCCAAAFAAVELPETLGRPLPETLDDLPVVVARHAKKWDDGDGVELWGWPRASLARILRGAVISRPPLLLV